MIYFLKSHLTFLSLAGVIGTILVLSSQLGVQDSSFSPIYFLR